MHIEKLKYYAIVDLSLLLTHFAVTLPITTK